MIRRQSIGKGNTQYTQISLLQWWTYQGPPPGVGNKEGTPYKKVQEVQDGTLPSPTPHRRPARDVGRQDRPRLGTEKEKINQLNRDRKAAEERKKIDPSSQGR